MVLFAHTACFKRCDGFWLTVRATPSVPLPAANGAPSVAAASATSASGRTRECTVHVSSWFFGAIVARAALCTALTITPAFAGRPLQTEDAGVLARGECEVEGSAARLSAADASERSEALQLGCGIGVSTQLALALALLHGDAADAARGAELNGKTELWRGPGGDDAPALVLAYGVLGVKRGAEGWRHAASQARLVHTRTLHPDWLLHANLGHARNETSRARSTIWGLAFEHTGIGAIAPMAELFGGDREPAWWNLGVRASVVRDTLYFDGSFGQQMSAARARLTTLGFKWVF